MSRIRTIKPEFWTSEQVVQCSMGARLLFIGLWNFCDDGGVHPASYLRAKMEVFPGDSFTKEEIATWIQELMEANLIGAFESDGRTYWRVLSWQKHQRIDRPNYRHPQPEQNDSNEVPVLANHVNEEKVVEEEAFDDLPPEILDEAPKPSKSISYSPNGHTRETSLISAASSHPAVSDIFEHWQEVMGYPDARLDKARQLRINQALERYSPEQLKKAIDGCARSTYHMGENDRQQRFDSIDLIFRNADHIEKFIRMVEQGPPLTKEEAERQKFFSGGIY